MSTQKMLFKNVNTLEEYATIVVKYPECTNMINREILSSALTAIRQLGSKEKTYFIEYLKYVDSNCNKQMGRKNAGERNKIPISIVGLSYLKEDSDALNLSYGSLALLSEYSSFLSLEYCKKEKNRIGSKLLETIVETEEDFGYQSFLLAYSQSLLEHQSQNDVCNLIKTSEKKELYKRAFDYAAKQIEEVGKYL